MKASLFKRFSIRIRNLFVGLKMPLTTPLYGFKYPDFQGAILQSQTGDEVQIVHLKSKERPYDVLVYSIELNRILGYVDYSLAKSLVAVFKNGFCLDGKITDKYVYDANFTACEITVYPTTTYMEPHLQDLSFLHGEENYGKTE